MNCCAGMTVEMLWMGFTVEIPPAYDEAINIQEGTAGSQLSGSVATSASYVFFFMQILSRVYV